MLSMFSLSFDSICLECESTSCTCAISYSCRRPMTPCPLLSKKVLTQQITTPSDPDVKWTVFTSVSPGPHGREPSQRGLPKTSAAKKPGRKKLGDWNITCLIWNKQPNVDIFHRKCFSALQQFHEQYFWISTYSNHLWQMQHQTADKVSAQT